MLALRLKLNSSKIAIIQSTYEVNLRGDFPKEEYLEMLKVQIHLLQALGQVGHALVRLDRVWRKRLVSTTAFLNQPLVRLSPSCALPPAILTGPLLPAADCRRVVDIRSRESCSALIVLLQSKLNSFLGQVSLALRQKSPLPQATPGPLIDRLLYHDSRLRFLSREDNSENATPDIEGASMGKFELTYDVLKHESFGVFASCLQGLCVLCFAIRFLQTGTSR